MEINYETLPSLCQGETGLIKQTITLRLSRNVAQIKQTKKNKQKKNKKKKANEQVIPILTIRIWFKNKVGEIRKFAIFRMCRVLYFAT